VKFKCVLYTWDDIRRLCKELASKIKESGFVPDAVVAIARGGWVPARIVCDYLDVKELYSVKTEHWGVGQRKGEGARITQPLNADVRGKKLLVVDDVADTGDTIEVVLRHLKEYEPSEIRVAVIDYKTTSKLVPDYYAAKMEAWRWIVYPWSIKEELRELIAKVNAKSVEEAAEALREEFDIEVEEEILRDVLSDC